MSQISSINNAVQSLGLKRDFVVAAIEHAKLASVHTNGSGKRRNVLYYDWELLQAAIEAYRLTQPQAQAEAAEAAARDERLGSIEDQLVSLTQANDKVVAVAGDVLDQSRRILEQGRLTMSTVTRFNLKLDNVAELLTASTRRTAQLDNHVMQLMAKVEGLEARLNTSPTSDAPADLNGVLPETRVAAQIADIVQGATTAQVKPTIAILGILAAHVEAVDKEFGDSFNITHFTNDDMRRANFVTNLDRFERVFMLINHVSAQNQKILVKEGRSRVRKITGSVSALKTALTAYFVELTDPAAATA